ncbi:MAG: hypothetical protein Q8P18_32180 [Pseudomonadota bacterium]|nr:hypothetical protein [Pseudomonadota bacterium]
MSRLSLLVSVLSLGGVLACRSPKGNDSGFVDDGQPHVFVASPAVGASVGGCFVLEVEVYNFAFASPVDEPEPAAGRGHFHAVFGPRFFDCEGLTCDIALTEATAAEVTVVAQLVGNDHNAIDNADGDTVTDERTFAYTGEPCPVGG